MFYVSFSVYKELMDWCRELQRACWTDVSTYVLALGVYRWRQISKPKSWKKWGTMEPVSAVCPFLSAAALINECLNKTHHW